MPYIPWLVVLCTAFVVAFTCLVWWALNSTPESGTSLQHDATKTDPGLLRKHSEFKSYFVPSTKITYPSIRVFYRQHPQASKLPSEPAPLPLLVFIHGLGGSASQFAPLLTSLSNVGPCLAVDLPGCGRSGFEPKRWDAYGTQALVRLLAVIIDAHRDVESGQGVILIGHSMGCSMAALLASPSSKAVGDIPSHTVGLIALSPRSSSLTPHEILGANRIAALPVPIFNLLRRYDKWGGTESRSVARMVGKNAQIETKKLQMRYNDQSKSEVFVRMLKGAVTHIERNMQVDGLPDLRIWRSLDFPVFLIGGEADTLTPAEEVEKISKALQQAWEQNPRKDLANDDDISRTVDNSTISRPPRALKTTILPPPASHGLFFDQGTCRTISGLIQGFLSDHVDKRLSLGWQLQHLSTEGKWDVKNLEKWRAVEPISPLIAGIFRAMKTMREVDDSHCPKQFVKDSAGKILAVVDISHESPVYDPRGLDDGGIQYHKFPTVSKLPPNGDEVVMFNDLVDRVREDDKAKNPNGAPKQIAVHCHYGFNRTGFFIVCYLVERMGWRLQDALEEFDRQRPPGVKHDYFVDALFVRYAIKFNRRPTII